ncbi:MAG: hypothetical protein JST82_09375 [Bacteroidetes bacterium]|nr:hypothetical protein [Bacteroidota bacterium]
MKIEYAKTIPLRKILFKIGFTPKKQTPDELLFISPFCNSGQESLSVALKTNTWFDTALGSGGDVIDLVTAYLQQQGNRDDEQSALRWLKNMMSAPSKLDVSFVTDYKEQDARFVLRNILPIRSLTLLRYLDARCIPRNYAYQFLRELRVLNKDKGKIFRAIGFRNEDGGFAIRSPILKASIAPNAITFIRGAEAKPDAFHVFRDIFDYLSILVHRKGLPFREDTIILNSYRNLNDATGYIRNYGYRMAYTWMENNPDGFKATEMLERFFETEDGLRHLRMNGFYAPHKSPNAWLIAKQPKKIG